MKSIEQRLVEAEALLKKLARKVAKATFKEAAEDCGLRDEEISGLLRGGVKESSEPTRKHNGAGDNRIEIAESGPGQGEGEPAQELYEAAISMGLTEAEAKVFADMPDEEEVKENAANDELIAQILKEA
jgi:hypothetical protein